MNTAVEPQAPTLPAEGPPARSLRPLVLVFFCTLLGAAAQVLMKTGAGHVTAPGLMGVVTTMFTSLPLFAGYCAYGVSTILLVLALREGELSLLYPVIALTYVWVTALSLLIFHEKLNIFKALGIVLIICGVGVLGRGGRKA